MNSTIRTTLLLLYFLLLIVTVGSAEDTPDQDESPAVYELRQWHCIVKKNKATAEVHNRIRINNRRGVDHSVVYMSEDRYRKLKNVKIIIRDAGGNIVRELNKKNLTKTCGYGASYATYDDICHYYEEIVYSQYPYTIDISYKRELKSLFFLSMPQVQQSVPVEKLDYKLEIPGGRDFAYREYGLEITCVESISGSDRLFSWSAEDIPRGNFDGLSVIDSCRAGTVDYWIDGIEFGDVTCREQSWEAIGNWYRELANECYNIEPTGNTPPAAYTLPTVKAAYDRVCDQTRYVSIPIGVSGWKPHKAENVMKLGYGDCKDMSTLLVNLLTNAGITAWPVLVLTRSLGPIDADFPNFGFNHVIACAVVNTDTIWIDPTCDNCALGDLPDSDENINVLLVDESGGHLVRTPESKASDNLRIRKTFLHLNKSGKLTVSTSTERRGNRSHYYRSSWPHSSADDRRKTCDHLLRGYKPDLKITDFNMNGIGNRYSNMVLHIEAGTSRKIRAIQGKLYIDPMVFAALGLSERPDVEERTLPLDIGYPETTIDSVIFTWDSQMLFDSVMLPSSLEYSCLAAKVSCDAVRSGDTVFFATEQQYLIREVPPSAFDSLLEHESVVREIQSARIILFPSDK